MDIKARLEKLEKARAAGQLDDAELSRLREELLNRAVMAEDGWDDPPSSVAGPASGSLEESAAEARPAMDNIASATLAVGMVIGPPERRMRLLHDLSGKGAIWLARVVAAPMPGNGADDEFRAIKIFLPSGYGARDAEREIRMQRADLIGLRTYLTKVRARVELAAKLSHPNIADVYGWRYGADGWPFAEMEYADHLHGHSLAHLLRERKGEGVDWNTLMAWLRPVADALDYARREHRLAHQHLDADTVFVANSGAVKLLSFGVAAETREPRSLLSSAGGVSAEGASESNVLETAFRRDVFALALLVYQLLAGRSAYEAQPPQSSTPLPRPGGLTDETWRVLRQGLAYPSELCPTDAGRFLSMLAEAQQPAAAARSGRGLAVQRKRIMQVAGLAVLVALAGYWLVAQIERTLQPAQSNLASTYDDGEVQPGGSGLQPSSAGRTANLQAAESEADLRAFESARRMDTLLAYRLYLQRCPRCGFGQEAHAAIDHLESQEKIAKLKADFETLALSLEHENREDRGDEALSRLNSLAAVAPADPSVAAGRRRLALAWVALAQASLAKSELNEARRRLKKARLVQPDLPEVTTLSQQLEQADVAEQTRQTDDEAFAIARRANSRRAYWAYLDRCGANCDHRTEAEAALVRLAPANPTLRDRLKDGTQGPEMVIIPAGAFLMGSPLQEKGRYEDESPHPVRIGKPFAIGRYEVMFYEYDQFATAMGRALPSDQKWGRNRRPVINVNWRDAMAYADWLSQQTGHRYRLPTEAEWEYAARAGTTASRYWGDDPNQGCVYANAADLDGKQVFVGWTAMKCHDGQVYTAPVGSYRSNEFGLFDVLGNVLEWTCSLYDKDAPATGQHCDEPVGGGEFVVRGGSWSDEPRNVRSAERHRSPPDFQDYFLGFRLVREFP